ncbi:hypothetical protein E1176_07935 [Fulvivirga sp. RKSG066]|uniref:hypothetical protein n=1 Tax=Fulvivirga aurantia TaxID=2529383 RepID=UPI0012BCF29B|nr:hypothetical protein [Fulvivirga aurantia]MTI20948.1 hypothetical protein [Fulvivirga aurantia]
MRRLIILITLSLFAFQSLAGGGWPQPKKKGYLKLNQWMVVADQYYTPAGDIISIRTTGVYTTSIYAEYGFTDRLTGIIYFPFFSRSTLNEQERPDGSLIEKGDELNSVGDTDLTLKYALVKDRPIVLSASLTLGLPFGNESGGRTELLQTGDGEFNQMLTFEASHSFYPVNLYASTLVGFNNRTNGFSDEFRYGAEVGYTLGKFTGIFRLYGIKPLGNGDGEINTTNGIFSNNVEYLAYSPELIYSFTKKAGISLSMGKVFYGKQILANPSYSAGVFLKF